MAVPVDGTGTVSAAAACTKALTFTWISHFRVPETITSDRGPQFTSNRWFQLCEMLNISHKQTTAYIQVLYKGDGVHPNWLDDQ